VIDLQRQALGTEVKKSSGVGAAHSQSDRTTQHKTNHKNILHANYFFIRAKSFSPFFLRDSQPLQNSH
jgi:hypothetical protein